MGSFTIGSAKPRPTVGGTVGVTDSAAEWILKLLEGEGKDPARFGLRVGVLGGGCSGYRYDIRWDEPKEGDQTIKHESGAMVLIDAKSFPLLQGSRVEYFARLQGAGFTVVNPNATNTCGCGESFGV